MGDKFKPWQDRRPKKKRPYQDDAYRGRKGKDRSNTDRQVPKRDYLKEPF